MADLNIGKFDKRVTFQYYPTESDGAGGSVERIDGEREPTVIASTWARVTDRSERRMISDYQDTVVKGKDVDVFYRLDLYDNLPNRPIHVVYQGDEYQVDNKQLIEEVKKIIRFRVTGSQ